ncbi:MAG: hypothetical protein HQL15_10135, partial [Candidatus Omnitrophica bacterium]|nr:hypothetical protein [Candidatus Omnitrophota bacterium]
MSSADKEIKKGIMDCEKTAQNPDEDVTERLKLMSDEEVREYLVEEEEKSRSVVTSADGRKIVFRFTRATPDLVDYYRNLEFSDLM